MNKMKYSVFTLFAAYLWLCSCQQENPLDSIILKYDTFQESLKDDDYPWPKISDNDISERLSFYQEVQKSLIIFPSQPFLKKI